jgi:hypothetical protein
MMCVIGRATASLDRLRQEIDEARNLACSGHIHASSAADKNAMMASEEKPPASASPSSAG